MTDISTVIDNVANGTDSSDAAKQLILNSYLQSSSNSTNNLLNVSNPVTTTSTLIPSTSVLNSNVTTDLSTSTGTTQIAAQTDRRIRLRPKSGISSFISNSILMGPLATTNGLIFPFTPRITVNHQAVYGDQRTTHANQDFRYYTNTPALNFDIVGEFTAQTQQEAEYLLGAFHFISTLTKMHSGGPSSTDSGLGLPPPLLLLSGFGPYVFNDLPVIVTNGSYTYDPSVDLVEVIVNNVSNDVPSLCTISISVTVQNTPNKLRTFDWNQFASGSLLSAGGWK